MKRKNATNLPQRSSLKWVKTFSIVCLALVPLTLQGCNSKSSPIQASSSSASGSSSSAQSTGSLSNSKIDAAQPNDDNAQNPQAEKDKKKTNTSSSSNSSDSSQNNDDKDNPAAPNPDSSSENNDDNKQDASAQNADNTCNTAELDGKIEENMGQAGADGAEVKIQLTNKASNSCKIDGYPGVSSISNGKQIGAPADRDQSKSNPAVTLQPGETATADLKIAQAGKFGCSVVQADSFQVFPPNVTDSLVIPYNHSECLESDKHLLNVGAFTKG